MNRLFSVELEGTNKARVTYNNAIVKNVDNDFLDNLLDKENANKL